MLNNGYLDVDHGVLMPDVDIAVVVAAGEKCWVVSREDALNEPSEIDVQDVGDAFSSRMFDVFINIVVFFVVIFLVSLVSYRWRIAMSLLSLAGTPLADVRLFSDAKWGSSHRCCTCSDAHGCANVRVGRMLHCILYCSGSMLLRDS